MINLLENFSKEDLKRLSEIDAESRNLLKYKKTEKNKEKSKKRTRVIQFQSTI